MSILNRNVWCVLGLPFDVVTLTEAVDKVERSVRDSERLFFSTPNLNFLITSLSDSDFFQSVVDSDLIVADGMPIIWMAKLLGVPLTERVAGSDVFASLSHQQGLNTKISVFFFGGQQGVAEQASLKLNESSGSMSCCGFYDPGFVSIEEMSTQEIIDYINITNPDFLLVALGAKKGQAWIQKNRQKLKVPVNSHLGAVVNFVAEHVERAPVIWQRFGLEWLWRIRQEPALWKRYLFDGLVFIRLLLFKVLPLAIYDRRLKRSPAFHASLSIDHKESDSNVIMLRGSVHFAALESIMHCFTNVLNDKSDSVILDCSQLEYIDGAFIGTLMLFQRYLNEQCRQLYLQNVPKRISLILDLNNALNRFQLKMRDLGACIS